MSEETFKITYISNGKTKESFYFKHFVDLVYPTLNQLKLKLFSKCGVKNISEHQNYKIYWIDEDGDEISIMDDDDLRIVADRHKSTSIKLNVRPLNETTIEENEAKATEKKQDESSNSASNTPADDTLPIHHGIICDGCNGPIHGFRYKCIQCHDYDLCRHCEAKMLHDQHLMTRIPHGLDKLPRKIDRVINLGRTFDTAEEHIRKFKKQEEKFRREEEKHKRDEEKHKRYEEKCKKRAHRRCGREQSRCHASAPPTNDEPRSNTTDRPGSGILYQVMDYLNYMMNPDNILENLNRDYTQPQDANDGCPVMNAFKVPPTTSANTNATDKAQEAKEQKQEENAAEEQKRSGFENFCENLKPSVSNAVPLGTDANIMTTSIGVVAKEIEAENQDRQTILTEPVKENTKPPSKPVEEILREKLQEKLAQMERDLIENDSKNRSSSPTISYTSEDSDDMNNREWTVLDNEDMNEGASGASGEKTDINKENLGAVPKEPKQVEDKATLTENSSTGSSMYGSANADDIAKKISTASKPEDKKVVSAPLSFEEMGKQLKAHMEEFKKIAVPIGPPANPTPVVTPMTSTPVTHPITPGRYPHPAPQPPKVYHPKPHINQAIHTMEGMGFSNDGGWLTSLLDTVDGNIPRALDLLQPHQK
uniref:CSON006313 protein n=1 Tax=Culicoides sonorensis TaxID=179676 RepID=A0A336KG47_CULSO